VARRELSSYVERIDVVCQTSGAYLALLRPGKVEEVLAKLDRRAKKTLKLGKALVKYEVEDAALTYVAPNRLVIRLRNTGSVKRVEEILAKLLSH